jgi:hypothetical protein
MRMRWLATSLVTTLLVPAALLGAQQKMSKPARFSAVAVNMSSAHAAARASNVEMVVQRWSTPAERDKLSAALQENEPNKLLSVLQSLPRVGSISTPDSVGYEVHYAARTVMPDKSEHISLITDRPLGFWEQANQNRSVDYPFTLVQLQIGSNGKGEGKLSVATKITYDQDTKAIELENYGLAPAMLSNVRREK